MNRADRAASRDDQAPDGYTRITVDLTPANIADLVESSSSEDDDITTSGAMTTKRIAEVSAALKEATRKLGTAVEEYEVGLEKNPVTLLVSYWAGGVGLVCFGLASLGVALLKWPVGTAVTVGIAAMIGSAVWLRHAKLRQPLISPGSLFASMLRFS